MLIIKSKNIQSFKEIPSIYRERIENFHPARINEFLSARNLLLEIINIFYPSAQLSDIKEAGHQKLKNYPDLTFSLTHSKDKVAVALTNNLEILNLGLDIESKTRKIDSKILKYLDHPDDDPINSLKKWVIKEAAFKYFSSLFDDENFWLKSIVIHNNFVSFRDHTALFKFYEGSEYYAALVTKLEVPQEVFHDLEL